jgi:8-oxo-dGTP diphosphatase
MSQSPTSKSVPCPNCGEPVTTYRNPVPTVDIIIECETPDGDRGILLIERANEPKGWAIPGGYVDYGETFEEAARREALEETGLDVELVRQFHAYSDPERDPRQHNVSVVFLARAKGAPRAGSDAAKVGLFTEETLPPNLAFDHAAILADYFADRY